MPSSLKKSQKQEQRLAKSYGGSTSAGSGNGWIRKNDVRTETLSFEAKYTDAKQFTLKQADLKKAEKYALIDGRESVFIISFSGEEWVVIREEAYKELHDAIADADGAIAEYRGW